LTAGRGKEGGEAAGRGGDRAAAPARLDGERKKKGKGGGEADRRAPDVSAAGEKEKEKRREVGQRRRLDGPLGPSGLERSRCCFFFLFFLFLFQTSFSNHFSFQIQIKLFKLFLKNFINFLETTQATKIHASQLMMHKHLLSLSLLNYI
jgi:hypothetical protein